jgi:hypothetical protein
MPEADASALRRVEDPEHGITEATERREERGRQRVARDRLTVASMKAQIAVLYRDGIYLDEIAARVSAQFQLDPPLSPKTVQYHVQQMVEYWRGVGLKSMDEKQAMLLARIDQIEMLATEAYFASMQGKSVTNWERQIQRARSKAAERGNRERVKGDRMSAAAEGGLEAVRAVEDEQQEGQLPDILVTTEEKIKEYERIEESPAGDPRWVTIMLDCVDKRAKLWGAYVKEMGADDPDREYAMLSDKERETRMATVLQNAAQRRQQRLGALAPSAPLGGHPEGEEPDQRTPEEEGRGGG